MAKEKPLRDWVEPSYNQEGRYNTLESKDMGKRQIPKHGDGMKEAGGPDKERRNK